MKLGLLPPFIVFVKSGVVALFMKRSNGLHFCVCTESFVALRRWLSDWSILSSPLTRPMISRKSRELCRVEQAPLWIVIGGILLLADALLRGSSLYESRNWSYPSDLAMWQRLPREADKELWIVASTNRGSWQNTFHSTHRLNPERKLAGREEVSRPHTALPRFEDWPQDTERLTPESKASVDEFGCLLEILGQVESGMVDRGYPEEFHPSPLVKILVWNRNE